MNQTSPKVIIIVVSAIAILAFIGVLSICLSLFRHTYADPAILTALISVTSGLVGSLTTILSSPRSQPPQTETTTTTTTSPAIPTSPVPPVVTIEQPSDKPIPTTEVSSTSTNT